MQIVAKVHFDPAEVEFILGLGENGEVQKFVDQECIRLMDSYTPNLDGRLIENVRLNSVIGSGLLRYNLPYARYHYYGVLFVDPITLKGSFYNPKTGMHWSRPNTKKIPDPQGRQMTYNKTRSPKAGSHWFERMWADNKSAIISGAAKLASERAAKV